MKPFIFTLRQLQYAVAVADCGRFHAAAAACNVSQPALSAQVSELERAIGVRIFERDRAAVVVTAAGAEVLERARRILAEAGELEAAGAALRDPFGGTLRIGVIPTMAPYVLPEVAPSLLEAFPRLRVQWREDRTPELVAALRAGELDAGIVAVEADLGDVTVEPLATDPFVVVVAAGHPLAGRASVGLADLAGEEVLLLEEGHCFRDQALAVCAASGADEAGFRATSLGTLVQMVGGGRFVALVPQMAVPVETRGGHLAVRPIAGATPHRTVALVWRRTAAPSFAAALQAIAGRMRSAMPGAKGD